MLPDLHTDICYIKGVGPKRAQLFSKLDIFTCFDLLTHFPRDYQDRSLIKPINQLVLDETVCVVATVTDPVSLRRVRKALDIYTTRACDDTGCVSLSFYNQAYIAESLKPDKTYVFYGKISGNLYKKEMLNPEFEPLSDELKITNRIIPIYPLSAGLTRNIVSNAIRNALAGADSIPDPINDQIRYDHSLATAKFSYENIHFPTSFENCEIAKRRLIFEELFVLCTGLMLIKRRREKRSGIKYSTTDISAFLAALPFELTAGQKNAIDDAIADLVSGTPLNRLIQGDVGCGKTMVAAALCYLTHKNGHVSALMAPTEILAKQHFLSLSPLLGGLGMRVELLTGSTTKKNRQSILDRLKQGEIDLIIGTHSLISEDIEIPSLALAITDEQHRFGVRQRATLAAKGHDLHTLVMSATPIPRTLALLMYGDLEVSIIDTLPPGRQPVDTFLVDETKRQRVYNFIKKHTQTGQKAYIVCPLTQGEDENLKAVEEYAAELEKEFTGQKVGFVHGKLKQKQKDKIMEDFAFGDTQILVATTVIEVGVNVPAATIMLIENAERFGLSQLHQLRGRVGRGSDKSYCIMFTQNKTSLTLARLNTMCATNNGFEISEQDLKLRGPGDFFGSRQHGMPKLKIADFAYDIKVLKDAQKAAAKLLKDDPGLKNQENTALVQRIKMLFQNKE